MCYNMLMLDFLNLEQNAPIFMAIGVVVLIIGFLMGGNAKKSAAVGVFSMFLKTVGAILALIAISYWVSNAFTDWSEYSDRML